jgi:hypothetical protein
MTRIFKFLSVYALWVVELGLALWLIFITRTVYLDIFALFYKPGAWIYSRRVDVADKFILLLFGIGWLVFMIAIEYYFRTGALKDDLLKRFVKVTGPVLLAIFGIDLILFWLQGGGDWWRWLMLAVELGIGITLLVFSRAQPKPKLT